MLGVRRYTVIFIVVPAEMKVIKSHASRIQLIATRVRKHFFIFAQFFLCIAQSIVCNIVCFSWSFPEAYWSLQDQHSIPEGSPGLIFLLLQQIQYFCNGILYFKIFSSCLNANCLFVLLFLLLLSNLNRIKPQK